MRPASPLCVFAAVGALLCGCNAFVVSPASIGQGLALPRQCGPTCKPTHVGNIIRPTVQLEAGSMADEIPENEQTKARAAFLDSPVLDDLMKTINKLKGFAGMEDDEAGDSDTEGASSEEEESGEETEQQAEEAEESSDGDAASDAEASAEAATTIGDGVEDKEAVVVEEEEEEEEEEGHPGLGSGGMADTRDPEQSDHADPRKSISAAPSFEEYLKMRQPA